MFCNWAFDGSLIAKSGTDLAQQSQSNLKMLGITGGYTPVILPENEALKIPRSWEAVGKKRSHSILW